ncbi:MAG: antibiotic biosynthesis monooxygenase [Ignavibacteria bacterium]|nr:antibiotic biosynthesis monooxygenase [Ignavibacteria bacterium]
MSNTVYWILETNIKDGESENLKTLMEELVSSTKENEPGALFYDWSISEDGKKCNILEMYKDSDAVMNHIGIFGKNYAARFMSMLEVKKWVCYGNPDDKVVNALSKLNVFFMKPLGGFQR